MSSAKDHYAALVSEVYRWSVSARGDPFDRARSWLRRHRLDEGASYLDLGAGFGAHALPLLRSGKAVTAVDFDAALLGELRGALGSLAEQATVHQGDLLEFLRSARDQIWDIILCAGDTITHLPDAASARELITASARHLSPQGALALELRDSTQGLPEGAGRFVEVARDAQRIMHCLLEAIDDDHLRVTDIVTDVAPDGPVTRISDYVKLRLEPSKLAAWAADAGLTVEGVFEEGGLVTLVCRSEQ